MARTEFTLTNTYQKVSDLKCVITVKSAINSAKIKLNTANSADGEDERLAVVNAQCVQNEAISVYAKGAGVVIVVDEAAS